MPKLSNYMGTRIKRSNTDKKKKKGAVSGSVKPYKGKPPSKKYPKSSKGKVIKNKIPQGKKHPKGSSAPVG